MRFARRLKSANDNFRLQKNRFTSTLATLLIVFLISACSPEENLSTAAVDTDPDTNTGTTGVDSGSVTETEGRETQYSSVVTIII